MNDKEVLDIYTDYLISSLGLTAGIGLSGLLDGAISHDRIQRFLARFDRSCFLGPSHYHTGVATSGHIRLSCMAGA